MVSHPDYKSNRFMNSLQFVSLLILISGFGLLGSASKQFPHTDARFTYQGRNYQDSAGLRYDWPCSSIQFCFVNSSKVWWLGSDPFSHYSVALNGNQTQTLIPKKNTKVALYSGKQNSTVNCIKLTKITEDHFGPLGTHTDATFKGVQLQGNQADLVRKENNFKYRLQFIGDSLTVGYGDMSGTNIKCFFRMRHNENCMQSWAHHLSTRLNAEYRMIAESGKGIAKNAPFIFGQTMPVLVSKTTSNSKPDTYHYQDKYRPDAVFVFLGVNDYNNLITPSEKNFVFGYEKMLIRLVELQVASTGNKPKIIGLCSVDMAPVTCRNVKKAIQSFNYAYNQAYYMEVPQGIFVHGNMGCINHPNAKGQRKIADALYDKVKAILEA